MEIVLTGSVAFDYLMSFPGNFKDHFLPDHLDSISLSFLVDSMEKRRGGTAPNIAYSLALLGQRPRLLVTVGEDFEEYRVWLENHGIDTSGAELIPGEYTASFFANTDRSNAQIASFYPGAMAYASQLSLKKLDGKRPDFVGISPNDPSAMKKFVQECIDMEIPYMYDPSQQIVRLEKEELIQGIEGAHSLFVNEYEFALIQKVTGLTSDDIIGFANFMVVTRGGKGASVFTGEDEYTIPVVPPDKVADPTGVGDAFRGGFLTAYGHGMDLEICGCVGALAATYCLEHHGPQGHKYSPSEFVERYNKHFEGNHKLEKLLS